MSPIKTSNSDAASSLLVEYSAGEHGRESEKRWWEKVLDLGEAKKQVLFSLPMIITSVSYDLILVVSVMFSGHLGERELAASNLANSWATITGFAFMIGLSGALETLCGQGYGAKLYGILGIYLQASCLISFFFSLIISIFWFYSEPILISLHQDPQISKSASLYVRFLVPGLFAFGFLHNTLTFLQAQGVVLPLVFCSVFPLTFHFGIAYFLVHRTSLGFVGAALAVSISLWVAALMVGVYVFFAKRFGHTWNGFSREAFYHVVTNLKLALPSAAMECLEEWAFELLVLLAGLMPNSEMTTSFVAMCTRVSNELGAGNPGRAKHAMGVTLKLSLFLVLIVVWALGFGHNAWAGFFSDSPKVVEKFASLTPFLLVSITIDSIQGVLSGVARGCGWQHLAVYINLATFYCIGMPISILLGFKMKLYAQGLWMGLICGFACQTGMLLLLTRRSKWTKMELSDNSNELDKPLPV
ncbi:protein DETOXIFICATION 18-like isoform X2 [Actinidia eriantha]|uniref:protein DETOXIFICATION 18-like isoform X2 n=1 Tax=Actinidia eriantha TaxID=165200 RepID=UPI002587FC53|nr:protein DETOXIFICATION 18-like isoform X2 [Actinidia eriantha]